MLLTAAHNCSYASCTGLLWGNLEQHVRVLRASVLCRLPDCKPRISAPGLESSEELNDSQSANQTDMSMSSMSEAIHLSKRQRQWWPHLHTTSHSHDSFKFIQGLGCPHIDQCLVGYRRCVPFLQAQICCRFFPRASKSGPSLRKSLLL